jgi:hypothetical protein
VTHSSPPSVNSPVMRALRPTRTFLVVAGLALLAAGARPAAAQVSVTTGSVRGTVVSGTAQTPVALAAVSATSEETGLTRAAQTDEAGRYTIRFLPPGSYTVVVRRIGFAPDSLRGVRVVVGSTASASFALREAAVQLGAVEVTGQANAVDVASAAVQTTVSQEAIQNLPALGRNVTDFINLSGLVSPDPAQTTGGQFSIAGQRPSQTNIQIDGVDANNAFFGENRGGSRIPFNFSLESIREFQVVTNGYDVEYGNYSGGIVNIVTRGGTNTLKGTVYGNYRGQNLTKKDFLGNEAEDFSASQFAAQVEGPIMKDKLFFNLSLDGQRRREPFQSVSTDFFRQSNNAAGLAAFQRFLTALDTAYGVSDPAAQYGRWETSNDVVTIFGRLDWNVNDKHRLSLRNNFATYENANETFTFSGGLNLTETVEDVNNSIVGELTSTLRPSLFNVLRVQHSFEDRPRTPNSRLPGLRLTLPGGQEVRFAGNGLVFDNSLKENKVQVIDNLTWTRGRHTLKVGTNNTFASIENRFWNNGAGIFDFASIADLEARRPSRYTRSIRRDASAPVAAFDVQEYAAYLQDDWQITPRLLAQVGVRYDVSRYSDKPGRVVDVERAFGFTTGRAPIDDNNFSPRASLTFDVNGDATQVIRAGTGLFYGRVPYVFGSNVAISDQALLTLDCSGSIAENDPDAPPIPDFRNYDPSGRDNPTQCASGSALTGVPEYSFWQNGFELPETWKGNLGYERLLTGTTRLKVDLLGSRSSKLYTVRNINLNPVQFTLAAEGGRRVFVPESQFNPTARATDARLRNTDFGNIFVNYNDGTANSFAGTFELEHRLTGASSVRASYTYTRAYDNSSFSCCTSFAGFAQDVSIGLLGPNEIGRAGDQRGGWGPSDYVRNHTVILAGYTRLPYGFRVSAFWRLQSGRPWTPENSGDLNGDGTTFVDRPFIFRPRDLPVYVDPSVTSPVTRDSIVASNRVRYANYLRTHDCIGKYQDQIIPRNTCRQPWFNRLDLSIRNRLPLPSGQTVEISADLFNVLNLLSGNWGRYEAISGSNLNLVQPRAYDPVSQKIQYTVPTTLGNKTPLGTNLIYQFSAQLGFRVSF